MGTLWLFLFLVAFSEAKAAAAQVGNELHILTNRLKEEEKKRKTMMNNLDVMVLEMGAVGHHRTSSYLWRDG